MIVFEILTVGVLLFAVYMLMVTLWTKVPDDHFADLAVRADALERQLREARERQQATATEVQKWDAAMTRAIRASTRAQTRVERDMWQLEISSLLQNEPRDRPLLTAGEALRIAAEASRRTAGKRAEPMPVETDPERIAFLNCHACNASRVQVTQHLSGGRWHQVCPECGAKSVMEDEQPSRSDPLVWEPGSRPGADMWKSPVERGITDVSP